MDAENTAKKDGCAGVRASAPSLYVGGHGDAIPCSSTANKMQMQIRVQNADGDGRQTYACARG